MVIETDIETDIETVIDADAAVPPAPAPPSRSAQDATAAMARWVADHPAWSAAAVEGARRAFVDTLAVMLAGRDEAATRTVRRAASGWGAGPAWCVLDGRLPAPSAALVNGVAAHALDWDDVLDPALNHPSAALVPAILSLGEELGSTGADCLDAYLTGFEVMARLGEAMNVVHYHRGWHTTLSIGAPGVAAACARLLGLPARLAQMALGLSVSMAGGSKRQFGSMAKPLHAGLAARNGIVAAQLAAAGVTAAEEVFLGEWGYVEMTSGPHAPGLAAALVKLGRPAAMEEYGVWAKLYPCCASTHRPVDALRDLAAGHGFGPGDLVAADCFVSPVARANLRFAEPAAPDEARFSLQYCMAATLTDGTLTTASFHPDAIARPGVRALMPLVRMHVDPDLSADQPGAAFVERARIELRLRDGRQFGRSVVFPQGHPRAPATAAALEDKFRLGAGTRLPDDRIEAAIAALRDLPRSSLRPLLAALA